MIQDEEDDMNLTMEENLTAWYEDLNNLLSDSDRPSERCEFGMVHVVDEIAYWEARLLILRLKLITVEHESLVDKFKRLKKSQSAIAILHEKMLYFLERTITEAKSNLSYLVILIEPCLELYNIETLSDIKTMVPGILVMFIQIVTESPYYNQTFHFDRLCYLLENQISYLCRNTVDPSAVLDDDVESVENLMDKCLSCCDSFIMAYGEAVRVYNLRNEERLWVKAKTTYEFKRRCKNVKYIMIAKVVFKRMDALHMVMQVSKFSFGPGIEFEKRVEKIHREFDKSYEKLREPIKVIFDVNDSDWLYHIKMFENEMNKLCLDITKLIDESLSKANNLIDGMVILQSVRHLFFWPPLQFYFQKKTEKLFESLVVQMQSFSQSYYNNLRQTDKYSTIFQTVMSDTAAFQMMNKLYKTIDRQAWLPTDNDNTVLLQLRKEGIECEKFYLRVISDTIRKCWDQGEPIIEPQLEENILTIRKPNPCDWAYAVNMHGDFYDLVTAIEFSQTINMSIPLKHAEFSKIVRNIKALHRNVCVAVKNYETISAGLSKEESMLFSAMLRGAQKTFEPLITKYNWSRWEVANKYLEKCYDKLELIQNVRNEFEHCIIEVENACKMIDSVRFYDELPTSEWFDLTDPELGDFSLKKQYVNLLQIIKHYNEIINYLTIVYEGIQKKIRHVAPYWEHLVNKVDECLVEESLVHVACESMKNVLEWLTRGKVRIMISIDLDDNEIKYTPSLIRLVIHFKSLLVDMASALRPVPRLHQTFKTSYTKSTSQPYGCAIAIDPVGLVLQENVDRLIRDVLAAIAEQMKHILAYRHVWENDKRTFFKKFKAGAPTADIYDRHLTRYTEYKTAVDKADITVSFVQLNIIKVQEQIVEHSNEWFSNFAMMLLGNTIDLIEDFYEYMRFNRARAMLPPDNLIEMLEYLEFQKRNALENMEKQTVVDVISDNMFVLNKHKIQTPDQINNMFNGLLDSWNGYLKMLDDAQDMFREKQDELQAKLLLDQDTFKQNVREFRELWEQFKATESKNEDLTPDGALEGLGNMTRIYQEMKQVEKQLIADLELFKVKYIEPAEFKIQNEFDDLHDMFTMVQTWDNLWNSYMTSIFWDINVSKMEVSIQSTFKELTGSLKSAKYGIWKLVEISRNNLDSMRQVLPSLIRDLRNTSMRTRHWDEIREMTQTDIDENDSNFTLENFMEMHMQQYREEIAEISKKATMELNIENSLKSIKNVWDTLDLNVTDNDIVGGVYRVKVSEETIQMLEDHMVQLYAIKGSRYISIFSIEADYWDKGLAVVSNVIEMLLSVQRQFMYAEKIFRADDVSDKIPSELKTFEQLAVEWRYIMSKMYRENNVFKTCRSKKLLKQLKTMDKRLGEIQKALELYMESKRRIFPRFYFISSDDLLDILVNAKNYDILQLHMKKCFDNINRLKIVTNTDNKRKRTGKSAVGMYSADGEYVEWTNELECDGLVEDWFLKIQSSMRKSLKSVFAKTAASLKANKKTPDEWISNWPGQLCITASQIQWTSNCTWALNEAKETDSRDPLNAILVKQEAILLKFSDAIRGELLKIDRLKIVALITIEIHSRDVIEKMYKSNCRDISDFEWMSQLRFYWEPNRDEIIIKQTNTQQMYGYEYLGNSGRLVITPLTDRCYITLTTALHLYRGGSPKGPAGTGKTETVKDLGKNLAYYVIVINCSDGLDYKSMGRMLSGLAQQGAWGCFDEFNRINIEVLSVVAQQILSIYSALASKLDEFVFEGELIRLIPTCGIFITMNPGYAGRTELPDNLKSLFRAISMMVPDTKLITEIMLFGEGFRDTRNLANKVYVLFLLCRQQLSKQHHYEFGLRGLVALLRYAGQCRRLYPLLTDQQVLLLAMHNMNLAKLTVDDLPLFMGITNDLFPSITLPAVENLTLVDAIKKCMLNKNHQPSEAAIAKVVQLYETKVSRHSVMLIGDTGATKSATWDTLRDTMALLKKEGVDSFRNVVVFPLNPKSLTLGELYGEYSLATQEWTDGVLSSLMRIVCSDTGLDQKWIIFDGPVDAVWIENMNSVMDDNKVLTLINSERITMPEQVSLLFEVEDLAEASPATVSRCGIVFNDYKDFGWKLYFESWLSNCEFEPYKDYIRHNFEQYIDAMLEFKKLNCIETVPLPELSSIQSLCILLECFTFDNLAVKITPGMEVEDYSLLIKLWFLFCMVWSVCAVVNEDGRKKIDAFLRKTEIVFPISDSVYHYYVDTTLLQFRHWENILNDSSWTYDPELPFYKIIVPTIDTVRYNYVVEAFMSKRQPVLLVGPVGTGKTSTVQKALDVLNKQKFLLLLINMSAQTTVHNIQETIDGRLEKRTKDIYLPLGNKSLITFLDDMNMPEKEVYGAQPPLELIRQWITYGFWYDRQSRSKKNVQKMLLIGAMGPPGGGRNTISNRLMSRFSMINLTFPEETQISNIFTTMLGRHMEPFDESIRDMRFGLTNMTIALYKGVVESLLPTPAKIHYLFNLRDISRVFQGLLRSSTETAKSVESVLRLWCNEVLRVFNDKLTDEKDREWFLDQVNALLGQHYEQTYRNLCSSEHGPTFCHFLNSQSLYEEVTDDKLLQRFINNSLDEYNTSAGVIPMNLVLFRDAIDHVCRITRVISQPKGYILLVGIGGSGRSSLARLSNWICDYKTFTIELTKVYGVAEFKEDLKLLFYDTGVKDQPTSFMFNDTQLVNETFLEIINNLLSTGEVSKLYKEDEIDEIKDALYDIAKKSGVQESTDEIYSFFLDRVKSNLHIILCFSPIGNKFRVRLRQYPSLINCTTIDWFLDWPKDALLEVAFRSLSTIEILETITGTPRVYDVDEVSLTENELRLNIANIFAIIHHSVVEYSNTMLLELKRYNYVTPTNYLELVSGYKDTLKKKRTEVANIANKLRNGLFKIDDTSEKVAGMTVELEKATEVVAKFTEECDQFLVVIMDQTVIADEQKVVIDEQGMKIMEEEIECTELYNIAIADLEQAMPALEEAMEALNALNKKDLSEVKSFAKPPERVKLVLEALMILKQSEPSWTEAKRQLGDPNFLVQLKEFDKDNVPPKVLTKIAKYTKNPEFEPAKVGVQSVAAKSLAKWVIAIEKYAIIFKVVAPKKKVADQALASLEEKQLALQTSQEKLAQIQNLLAKLKIDFDGKMEEKEQLAQKALQLTKNLERAASLIEGLSGERMRWIETVGQLDVDFDNLPGDCLISIAFVSYMGPFVFKYRDSLLSLWTQSVTEMKIPNNPKYETKAFLSDPALLRHWNIHGLPNDDLSTENGIIISRSSRWPLIIDPQCQALKWIKHMEAENDLKVIDFCLPDYMEILEDSLRNGYPTLLQITSEDIDPAVMPVLSKSIVKERDEYFIKMGDKLLPYSNNFRFFITTKIRNPYYPPEIFTRATVINFAIKEEGLEDQLLDVVITMEKPKLKKLKDSLIINIDKGKKTLIELEDELLRLLNESEGSLLANDELFRTLASSKITSANVNKQLENSLQTQNEIDFAREGYRTCAKRASILFFILNELNQIDPMYQFSLDSYMDLFENSIRNSEQNINLEQRLDDINYYHTYAVYQNTCRGLFEVHKLLFSFQISISLLLADELISPNDVEFLFKGGIVLNKVEQAENPCKSWLPSVNWDNISELNKIPGFLGVEKSFEQYSREWKNWYLSPKPETLNLIGKWHINTNAFQKLIFVRCLRLDRLSFAVSDFIASDLGRKFVEPPVLDVRVALEDSSNKTPLMFLLSPGVDPTGMLLSLASMKGKLQKFHSLSLGQGQAPIATELIRNGQANGDWVFLANCHLSLSWMPQLDKIVEVMQDGRTHEDFRLWLSSNPNPDFPIAILQSSVKMTTEPPKGLKANMRRLYNHMTDDLYHKCQSRVKYTKLLFSLCFFHSILIERKKFQNLGWNVVYSFNDSDFVVSENLLSIYLDEYAVTPWDALKYLIAGICYGGQVTDDFDRRLLNTYINQYFNENAITTPYYKLSSLTKYYIPLEYDLDGIAEYIDTLPIVDNPEAFGQHSNAEMASLMELNRMVCDTLLVLYGQSSATAEENKEQKVLDLSSKILKKIPETIDYYNTVKNIGAKRGPLSVVLLQEVLRYNTLLEEITVSLVGLEKGIRGLAVMSSELEEVFQCVYEGRVPGQWLKTYPSLMTLGSWTQDLIERIEHFNEWAEKISPPILFWLGGFTYPTSFLTAVLQIHSRETLIPIDLLNWEFVPISIAESDIVVPPQNGVYVRNLYLEGANWDFKNSCLCEPLALQFVAKLPVIQFKAVKKVPKNKSDYQCPVYYYPLRSGTPGRDSFIVVMDLKSGLVTSDHWVKRAAAVLLNLSG